MCRGQPETPDSLGVGVSCCPDWSCDDLPPIGLVAQAMWRGNYGLLNLFVVFQLTRAKSVV